MLYICTRKTDDGVIAQSVEQRTENPCVPGSIPGDTTEKKAVISVTAFLFSISKVNFNQLHRHFQQMGKTYFTIPLLHPHI